MSQPLAISAEAHPDDVLDIRGETCPFPELYTAKKLRKMNANQILEVLTDHAAAFESSLPSLAQKLGYPFEVTMLGNGLAKVRIQKR